MRTTVQWLLIVACLITFVACRPDAPTIRVGPAEPDTATPQADPVVVSGLADLGLKVFWQIPTNLEPREAIDRLIRLDEKLYCITNQNRLIAVDAMRGVVVWRHQVAPADQQIFDPVHADELTIPDHIVGIDGLLDPDRIERNLPYDAVMINTQTYLMLIDRLTGRVVRNRHDVSFDFAATSSGTTDGVFFYVGTASGDVAAVRPAEAITAWRFVGQTPMSAPPVYYSNHVFVGTEDNLFFAIRLVGGRKALWSQDTAGAVTAPFFVGERGAFVPCEDMQVYAFDSFTGEEMWETPFVTRGPCRRPIQVGRQTVFQYADEDRLYAINLYDGQERWSMPNGRIVMAVMEDKVYVLDTERVLHVVDELTGEEVGAVSLADYDVHLANTSAPAIYAAKHNGELVCIRLTSAGRLTAEMLEATPRP